jgi:O-succinylbenzoate synthase
MQYGLEFRSYSRSFKVPLRTHHGVWTVREGILLRLTDDQGRVGWGEIAPLPWFGTETMAEALSVCQQLPPVWSAQEMFAIPDRYRACQFGLESAWEMLTTPDSVPPPVQPLTYSYLLPTGAIALDSWQVPWRAGYRTFKCKIGVGSIEDEWVWIQQLLRMLPVDAKLRLDANGGLSDEAAGRWLAECDRLNAASNTHCGIELIEQPLPPHAFDRLLDLSHRYQTPIALDESVTSVQQLETAYEQGWRGIFVVKAAIAGSIQRLRSFCLTHDVDVVWSSVFETAIARQFIETRLIPSVPQQHRAIGFGVNQWLGDRIFDQPNFEEIWQTLSLTCNSAARTTG